MSKLQLVTPLTVDTLYNNDKQLSRDQIKSLEEWAAKQAHLPQITEFHFIFFLTSNDYRLEPTKVALDNYFTIRSLAPDIFHAIYDPPALRKVSTEASIFALPDRTPDGCTVIVTRLIKTHPDDYHSVAQVKYTEMVITNDILVRGPSKGLIVVLDMRGMVMGHMTRINLAAMRKYTFYALEAAPIRIRSINYVNVQPFVEKMLALMRPVMRKEYMDLIKVHAEPMDEFYKLVPRELLPKEMGGKAATFEVLNQQTVDGLIKNIDNFKWNDSFMVDETKRMGKPKILNDVFGVDGSFKKLEVD